MPLPIFTLAGPTYVVSLTATSSTSQLPMAQLLAALCTATDADALSLTANQRVVKIARSTLTRIEMYQPGNGHHLADLGNSMSRSFARGFGWLFSPAAPLGLVAIPATIAWGAVAAPFCLLGDLGDDGAITQDIKVSD